MQYSSALKFGIALAGTMTATMWLRAQTQEPSGASKEAPTAKEAPAKEGLVRAVGLPTRPAATDYQARVQVGTITIAAESHAHNIPTEELGPYTSEDFVAVEVALFGPPNAKLQLSPDDFSLRVNGKKNALMSQSYLMVWHSLKDPSWEPPDNDVKSKTTFTGGPQGDSLPPVIHMPPEMRHAMEQRVQKASLPEGDRALPQSGLLFFEYHGQTKNIRSMELVYAGPGGKAALALRP